MKYLIRHVHPIEDTYIPHYATLIETNLDTDGLWATMVEFDEEYEDVATDWMWNTDDILEYGPVM